MEPFTQVFAQALARAGMTRLAFAKRSKTPVSTVSEVLHGHRKPPLKRIERWADVLEIPQAERLQWRRLAALCHAPPEVSVWVEGLISHTHKLENRLDKVDRFARQISTEHGVSYDLS